MVYKVQKQKGVAELSPTNICILHSTRIYSQSFTEAET
jgi:hypothetical protein